VDRGAEFVEHAAHAVAPADLGVGLEELRHLRQRVEFLGDLPRDFRPLDLHDHGRAVTQGGGMHLPDIFMFKPVFIDGRLLGYAVVVAHHNDMGGRVPGSSAADSTEIYQEGLRIPPLKLFERDVPNDTLFSLLAINVRVPEKVLGDVRAQVAALHQGERDFLRLVSEYGPDEMPGHTVGSLAMIIPVKYQGREHPILLVTAATDVPNRFSFVGGYEHVWDTAIRAKVEGVYQVHPNTNMNMLARTKYVTDNYPPRNNPLLYGAEKTARYLNIMRACTQARMEALGW
jgi:hypothetical protein